MRSYILPTFVLLLFAGSAASAQQWTIKCGDVADVRLHPLGVSDTGVQVVSCGESVTLLDPYNFWVGVRTADGRVGYISSSDLAMPIEFVSKSRTQSRAAIGGTKASQSSPPVPQPNGSVRGGAYSDYSFDPAPGLKATFGLTDDSVRKSRALSPDELERRFNALRQTVESLARKYASGNTRTMQTIENELGNRKQDLAAAFLARQAEGVSSSEEADFMLGVAATQPQLPLLRLTVDSRRLRFGPVLLSGLLESYLSDKPSCGHPEVVQANGLVLGLLEAYPETGQLSVDPGGQAVSISRKFTPAHYDGLTDVTKLYGIQIHATPTCLPGGTLSSDPAEALVVANGKAIAASWPWQFGAGTSFKRADITFEAELRTYPDDDHWRARVSSGQPESLPMPIRTVTFTRSPDRQGILVRVLEWTYRETVDLFGLIGALPTVALLWSRRWRDDVRTRLSGAGHRARSVGEKIRRWLNGLGSHRGSEPK